MLNIDRIWKICIEKDFKLSNLAMHSVIQACVLILFCTSSFFIRCNFEFIQIWVFGLAVMPYHFVEGEIFWWICLPNISLYTYVVTSSCEINSDAWKKNYIHFKFQCNILVWHGTALFYSSHKTWTYIWGKNVPLTHRIDIFQLYLMKGVLCSTC